MSSSHIRVLEHTGIGGNLNDLKIDRDDCVMIIDDLDVLERWTEGKNLELRRDRTLNSYLDNVAKGICQLLTGSPVLAFTALPLRCGLNAVAYNQDRCAISDGTTYGDLLFGPEFAGLRIGFWDRPAVNIPLLLLATRIVETLHDLNSVGEGQMEELTAAIERRWSAQRSRAFCTRSISALRQALGSNRVDLVIGGGAWLHRDEARFRTFVPKEGALLWLECASLLTATDNAGGSGLQSFARRLLDPNVQKEIAIGEEYSACPVIALPELWKEDKHDIRKIFVDETLDVVANDRHLRRAPKDQATWANWLKAWQRIKERSLYEDKATDQ